MSNTAKPSPKRPKKDLRSLIWYFLLGLMALSIVTTYMNEPQGPNQIEYSDFLKKLEDGNIKDISIIPNERTIIGTDTNNTEFKTFYLEYPDFIPDLKERGINIKVNPNNSSWVWSTLLQALLPFILIAGLWFFIFRQAQGANSQAMGFGKSRAKTWKKEDIKKVTFKDVAGIEEAKEELEEIVDFLKAPKKYKDIGAKIPKGVLLMGSPGTGKTLLAKAIAGEADVPFYSISGSDFVEMFVGVGASRVRDMFSQAKKSQPCIIFIDEIDAVGRQRGAGLGGGHDEREQTLNQLLVEMDGFDETQTIIVIAATNRPDILDPALLRPGRFDRQVTVDKPDTKGRQDILKIHAAKRKIDKKVDLEIVAKRTPGFTGADLANLINEGALLAARNNRKTVSMKDLEEATDRVMAGPQRKSRLLTEKEKDIVTYHELGHAIVAVESPCADPVHKVSILPRGRALGYTLQLPGEDKHLVSRTEMETQIKVLMGGRIAEEIMFGEITTGASNDIERATDIARHYVCTYGMSDKLGTRKYGQSDQQVFLGRDYGNHSKDYSEETSKEIDNEIKRLIDESYKTATTILKKHKKAMIEVAKVLHKEEVLEGKNFLDLYEKAKTHKKKVTKKASTKEA